MNKITFAFLILLVVSQTLIAQTNRSGSGFQLTLSSEMKEPYNSTIDDYLGQDDNGLYVLRQTNVPAAVYSTPIDELASGLQMKPGYLLESYNEKMVLIKKQELAPEVNGDRTGLSNVAFLDGKLFVYFILVDKKADQTELYYQPIDNKTLQLIGLPKKIITMPFESKGRQGNFQYDLSKDKKTIAITANFHDDKATKEQFTIMVFDASMTKLWQREVSLPYESRLFASEAMLLDNNGNIYLRGRVYTETVKEKKKGLPNYSYKILAYRDNGKSFKEYSINLEDKFITDLGFSVTDDDKLAIAGFFSDKGTTSIKGIVFELVDAATEAVVKQGIKEFDEQFMELFRKADISKKNDEVELWGYDLDNIIIRTDGGALLLAEKYYVKKVIRSSSQGSMMGTYADYYFYYNDIIAINVNPDLTIAWATKVPKRQKTKNDGGFYSSYANAIKDDKIYLLFNDDPKNIGVNDPKVMAEFTTPQRSVATLVTIESDGKWEKSLVFSNKAEGVILRPKVCEQSSPNQMFLYAEKGKTYMIGKVDL